MNLRVQFLLANLFCFGGASWALGPVQFGAEFTFTNIQTFDQTGMDRVVERMRQHLINDQPDGEKFIEEDIEGESVPPEQSNSLSHGRFTSPHGWWFEWGPDDGVIEAKTIPADVEFYRRIQGDMQDAIFVSAANEGFAPAPWLGGGHINLGTSVFRGNDLLLRNFLVDMINHNELFLGVFNHDTNNAASFCLQTRRVQRSVYKVIANFDRGRFTGEDSQLNFLKAMHQAMDLESGPCFEKWKSDHYRWPYQGFNLSHVSRENWSRIELRGVRPQLSMDMWVRQIDLIYHRLLFLEKIKQPLEIKWRVPVKKLDFVKAEHHLNPPVDPQLAMRSFYTYVTESGLRWVDHRDYLWPQWTWSGALAQFESSNWFKSRERSNADGACGAVLATP